MEEEDVFDDDDEEEVFLKVLAEKVQPGLSDSDCLQMCSACGTFVWFVSFIGAVAGGIWFFTENSSYNSNLAVINSMDAATDFIAVTPGCNINFTRHAYEETSVHNHASKKSTYTCVDYYFYNITDLSSSSSKWPSVPQSQSRSCDSADKAESIFSGVSPTDVIPCWRAVALPANGGYTCGNDLCLKINDPTDDYQRMVSAQGASTMNRDNAFGVFLPCLLVSLPLYVLLCWGPGRCRRRFCWCEFAHCRGSVVHSGSDQSEEATIEPSKGQIEP
jgi:hypothetical protein